MKVVHYYLAYTYRVDKLSGFTWNIELAGPYKSEKSAEAVLALLEAEGDILDWLIKKVEYEA